MGQKVNPIGFRLGGIRTWDSTWFAPKRRYAEFLKIDEQIRKYVEKKFKHSWYLNEVEINRAAKILCVNIHTSRPGIVIGKKGAGAESI